MAENDRIGDAELQAYVDGQLDAGGRVEVEDFLARHPDFAAQVMADLGTRDALRLAFPLRDEQAPAHTQAMARRLQGSLTLHRAWIPLRRLAAAVVLFALGWGASLGWTEWNRAPDQTQMLARVTQLGEDLDVRLPRLPQGWEVLAAQRAETPEGPAVRVTFRTPEFGRLSLLARNTHDVDFVLPTVESSGDRGTAHWQLVSDRYDLTANLSKRPLEFAALELFQTLY